VSGAAPDMFDGPLAPAATYPPERITMTEAEAAAWRPEIPGWSDDILPFYDALVRELPLGARFVEVGIAHGRSAAFLAERLAAAGRLDVELYFVDFWPGEERKKIDATVRLGAFDDFTAERSDGTRGRLYLCKMTSAEGAARFADAACDVAFLDADHSYEGLKADIAAWLPKVKSGGILCGHDYSTADWPGVVQAVDEAFGARVGRPTRSVWEVRIPEHGDHG
jgi:predicted O-methyltransferase YrrM